MAVTDLQIFGRTAWAWRAAVVGLALFLGGGQAGLAQEPATEAPVSDWVKVAPEGAGFEILMPGEPKHVVHDVRPLRDRRINVNIASFTTADGKALFMTAYHDLGFDAKDEKKIRDILDGGVQGSLLNAVGKISKHEHIKLGDHPGRHFEFAGNRFGQKIEGVSRIYLVGRRVIQATVIRAPETAMESDIAKFFDSLQWIAAEEKPPADPFSTGEAPQPKDAEPPAQGGG